ncbi:chromosomal replication initiator protein DnaA [Sedimentibacter hydroxybenzoicus DSM 7310]|uniref:Chromosomal replication initiator protein DnaA n=1 Tax=Sedimentibacter hydroxybenzoicus DSM 7310 TaxID=1123245 RepID=A0A974BM10_SEDHY|nr:chromosomal replication initiator protein DnaA [Sedimentibacter hydroxybenzoicus]NYB75448.1 chromosomal replication initiator protein DnaA [Sedimentibacter hydroxybenzoicus DSM 7310]
MNFEDLWNEVLEIVKEDTNQVSFNTWFKPLKIVAYKNNTIYLETADDFLKNTLKKRHYNFLKNAFTYVLKKDTELIFTIPGENINKEDKKNISVNNDETDVINTGRKLNPKYRFDNFIIGNSNRFAHAASLAVAEAPATAYNPLFLYGGVGLGKTHLMHAIGHYILDSNPDAYVLYVTSEKFTNDLINSIKDGTNEEFRNTYRKADVLLVDDIQFIAGKESTQEEFFHTFNALHEANKQIIVSSDNPPSEIPTLEDRLRSRFEWGLIADIQPPDYETRIAILRKKAEAENYNVPDDVISYIAQNIQSNIRKLEGALIRIYAYASLTNKKEVNLELAQEALKHLISNNKKITINDIKEVIANYYNISIEDLISKRKTKNIAYPRQIAMYIGRKLTDLSLPKLGEEFGGRDHSTVLHAYNKVEEDIENSQEVKKSVDDLISMLNN